MLQALQAAITRRRALFDALHRAGTDCCRILHGIAEGVPGLTVDRYGPLLLAQTFRDPLPPADVDLLERALRDAFGQRARFVYNHHACTLNGGAEKGYERYHKPPAESLEPVVCREGGIRYLIVPRHRGQDPLLFLDLRSVRRWVRNNAAGRSVLNLFAYTCGVGLAASVGGAREVWNVDFGRSCLEVGAANAQLNGIAVSWLAEPAPSPQQHASGTVQRPLPLDMPMEVGPPSPPPPPPAVSSVESAPTNAPKRRGRPRKSAAAPIATAAEAATGPAADAVPTSATPATPPRAPLQLLRDDVYPVLWQLSGTAPRPRRGRVPPYTPLRPRTFDLIVLDPPTLSRGKFQAVDIRRDYPSLFKPAVRACADGGWVLCTNHSADVGMDAWQDALQRCAAKAGRRIEQMEVLPPDDDFPTFDGQPPLKAVACRLDG